MNQHPKYVDQRSSVSSKFIVRTHAYKRTGLFCLGY